jgi:hypothetical protein
MSAKTKKKEVDNETDVVEGMIIARSIAKKIFGESTDALATEETFFWLSKAPSVESVEEDLKRIYDHAKRIHETETPTSEMVFGLFALIFDDPDDDEE